MAEVRDSLHGTWDLVSFSARLPDGSVTEPWGAHPVGRITYDSDGNVSCVDGLMLEKKSGHILFSLTRSRHASPRRHIQGPSAD